MSGKQMRINRKQLIGDGRYLVLIVMGAALLFGLWLFIPPYYDAFIGDDYVQLNRVSAFLSQPFDAWEILLPNWQAWYYRPLQNYAFLINQLIYGFNPFGHYIGVILWHLLATALVSQLGRRLGFARQLAAGVALLFSFHGHYYDVVTWVSAVAIVAVAAVSALALILFVRYLVEPERKGFLLGALLVVFIGLLTHEEAFLLPPKLFLLWMLYPAGGTAADKPVWRQWLAKLKEQPWTTAAMGFMGALMVAYLYIQWARPNVNINLRGGASLGLSQIFDPGSASLYLVQVFMRTTNIFHSLLTSYSHSTAVLILTLLALWFWRANWLGRFGLLWWGLHIAFIYAALWVQRPEFFGGRHIYNANVGLVVAIGAAVSQLTPIVMAQASQRKSRRPSGAAEMAAIWQYGLPLLLAAVLIGQSVALKQRQQGWQIIAERDRQAQRSLKEMIPELTEQERIFAHRFVIDVTYMEATLKAWYDRSDLNGFSGPLRSLPQWGWLPDNIYLIDYANDAVVNLMPELSDGDRYLLLWAGGPQTLTVAGPPGDQRLAVSPRLPDEANVWQPLTYRLSLDGRDTTLNLAAGHGFGDDNALPVWYRVRLAAGDETHTLHEEMALPGQWHSHAFPLDDYPSGDMTFYLEIAYVGERPSAFYWGNPHLSRVVE
jgi:hypothetical protein